MSYQPPLTLTPKILNLVAAISEQLGRYDECENKAQALRLRRVNKIRTIQGSLAIEGNSLSVEQITAVLEGKPVIAPPREVQEVKNALAVYERFTQFNALKEEDLLQAHHLPTYLLNHWFISINRLITTPLHKVQNKQIAPFLLSLC